MRKSCCIGTVAGLMKHTVPDTIIQLILQEPESLINVAVCLETVRHGKKTGFASKFKYKLSARKKNPVKDIRIFIARKFYLNV
jgi:hypothetical protein